MEVAAADSNDNFSKTKKHFAALGHKFDTDKLRVMLREVWSGYIECFAVSRFIYIVHFSLTNHVEMPYSY